MEHSNLLHPGTALGHSFRVTEEIDLLLRPIRVSFRAIMREVTTFVWHAPTSRFPVVDSSRRPTENIDHLPQHRGAVRHKAFMRGLVKGGPPRAVIHFLERHSTTLLSAIRSTCDRCPLRSVFELLSPERKRPHGVASLPPQSSGRGFSCSWKRLAPGALPLTGSFLSRFCYFGLK